MQLIEMTVSGGHVRLLYANAATKDEASEWLEFRVHSPSRGNQRLGVIQQTALHRVRELIDAENERFVALSAQLREYPMNMLVSGFDLDKVSWSSSFCHISGGANCGSAN